MLMVVLSKVVCLDLFKVVPQKAIVFILRLEPNVSWNLRLCVLEFIHKLWVSVGNFLDL